MVYLGVECKMVSIYFIGSDELGAVKIGKSNNPMKRLSEIQTGNPYKLVLYRVVENVNEDYEIRLHEILDHIRLEGEWFKLTDELIHFMANKTDETCQEFKLDNQTKPCYDLLDLAINKIVKPNKNGQSSICESDLISVIRKYLIFINESTNFDTKMLRQKLKNRGIFGYMNRGELIYLDYHIDEKEMQPEHYLGPASRVSPEDRIDWDDQWILQCKLDSKNNKNIKFSQGYSHITPTIDGTLTVSTILTKAANIENEVVIYKENVYNASCLLSK